MEVSEREGEGVWEGEEEVVKDRVELPVLDGHLVEEVEGHKVEDRVGVEVGEVEMEMVGVVVPLAVLVRLMELVGERDWDRELVWEIEIVTEDEGLGDVSVHTTFRTLLLSGSGMYRVTRLGVSVTAPIKAIWFTGLVRVPKQALVPVPSR